MELKILTIIEGVMIVPLLWQWYNKMHSTSCFCICLKLWSGTMLLTQALGKTLLKKS